MFSKLVQFCLCLASALLLLSAASSQAQANPKYASIVMDADTGLILHQRHANKKLHPASLTKVMTLLMVFDALERGDLKLSTRIPVSRHAASMVPSKLGLKPGSSIRVKDAIYALVTKSANDVAVAVAERLGGSEVNFAKMMTRRARLIGMRDTRFRNASGLHHKAQVSTARDMAKMARYVINAYPTYYRYFSTAKFSYAGQTYHSHNRLMKTYAGMDGMKTGYINASGFNLVASAVQDNRRIIGVVFGGRTSKSRNAHMKQLLDRGFKKVANIRIARAPAPLPKRKPGAQLAAANLSILNPASEDAQTTAVQRLAGLNAGDFSEITGQGDFDPGERRRIETGLMAIAALKGESIPAHLIEPQAGPDKPVGVIIKQRPWAVQVGAYRNRHQSDTIINRVLSALPHSYAHGQPLIVPTKVGSSLLYRARLTGYTQQEARQLCRIMSDCLPVAP